jgi:hypothetical protein
MNGRTDHGVRQGSACGPVPALRQRIGCSAFERKRCVSALAGVEGCHSSTNPRGGRRSNVARKGIASLRSLNENSGYDGSTPLSD